MFGRRAAARLTEAGQRVIATGTPTRVEFAFRRRHTQRVVYDVVVTPLRDDTGEIIGLTNAVIDISERRQAEERRRQQAVQDRQTNQQLQLDFERQRALQAEQTRIEIEEQRLFQQWQREQGARPS